LFEEYYPPGRPRPYDTTYGDGGPIDVDDVHAVYAAMDEAIVAFPWQLGDVLVLDNILTGHGRNTFTGPRDIQVAMLA
jgi:alpha-ketoglutarate-dependent taurine dioxygenase